MNGERRNMRRILVGKPEGKDRKEDPIPRWMDNIKGRS
jgi:hypothetical protein